MKRIFFVLLICAAFFIGCDPKIDRRAPRYDAQECPICGVKGKCRTCKGTGKCSFCNGKGKRITSTKNFTGEGINLIDYEEECPFCKGTGTCAHCRGEKTCSACGGLHKVDKDWNFLTGKKSEGDEK